MNSLFSKETARSWLQSFRPDYSQTHEKIYLTWLERMDKFARQKNITANEDFFWQKTLSYFFPQHFLLNPPFLLPDILVAVDIIKELHVKKTQQVVFYGDRDADGLTSSAILQQFFVHKLGLKNVVALSPQEDEKYGITIEVAERILKSHPDILIVLDCGSLDKENFEYIKKKIPHIKTIVLDHHNIPEHEQDYPPVEAFINPKRLSSSYSEQDLCTAGLAYKFIHALSYAFTRNYHLSTKIVDGDFATILKNGIKSDSHHFDRTMYFGKSSNNKNLNNGDWNGEELWQEKTSSNKVLSSFVELHRKVEKEISCEQKYLILENLSISSLTHHVRPYLAYAAIGTVADMMPLVDDNRIMVAQGLHFIRHHFKKLPVPVSEFLKKLSLSSRTISEQDFSFTVCPTINAAGRLGKSKLALEALIEDDPLLASAKAKELMDINKSRKQKTKQAMEIVEQQIDDVHKNFPIAVVYNSQIHRGISGLVANKIAELLQKPAVVLVDDGESLRGSVRSYQNENVFALLNAVQDLLLQSGGHRQAAGFSLAYDKIDLFTQTIYQKSKEFFLTDNNEEVFSGKDFYPPINILDHQVKENLWDEISLFAPYGEMNPHPVFSVQSTEKIKIKYMGEKNSHARIQFTANKRSGIEAVWFFHSLQAMDKDSLHDKSFLAEPHVNFFAGRTNLQLQIKSVDEKAS